MLRITEQQRFLYALHIPPAAEAHIRTHPAVGKTDWATFVYIDEAGKPSAIQRFHNLETGEKSWSQYYAKVTGEQELSRLNSATAFASKLIAFRNDQKPEQVLLECDGPTAAQKLSKYDWGALDW